MLRHLLPLTLFPYTTLFRSLRGLASWGSQRRLGDRPGTSHVPIPTAASSPGPQRSLWGPPSPSPFGHRTRSEEHTSELQSHSDHVCRLLLEKKNARANALYP